MRTLVSHASGRWFETGRVRLREPFLERGARECGAGAWQQPARGHQAPVGIGLARPTARFVSYGRSTSGSAAPIP